MNQTSCSPQLEGSISLVVNTSKQSHKKAKTSLNKIKTHRLCLALATLLIKSDFSFKTINLSNNASKILQLRFHVSTYEELAAIDIFELYDFLEQDLQIEYKMVYMDVNPNCKFSIFYFWTAEKAQEALEKINNVGLFKGIPITAILKFDGNDWSQCEYRCNAPSVPMMSS